MSKLLRRKGIIMGSTKELLNQQHSGAVAFEYIIILVIMAVAIFTAWKLLSDQVISKAKEIADFIKNNGQTGLGTGN